MLMLAFVVSALPMQALAEDGPTPHRLVFLKDGRSFTADELLEMTGVAPDKDGAVGFKGSIDPAKVSITEMSGTSPFYTPGQEYFRPDWMMVGAGWNVGDTYPPESRHMAWMHWSSDTPDIGSPNDSVAYLDILWPDGSGSSCTGWVFGADAVATNAHCLYQSARGGTAIDIIARFGVNAPWVLSYDKTVLESTMSDAGPVVPIEWATTEDYNFDYGAFFVNPVSIEGVDTPIGAIVGGFGFRTHIDEINDIRMWPFNPRIPNQWYQGKHWTVGYPNYLVDPVIHEWDPTVKDPDPDLLDQFMPMQQFKTGNDKAIWGTSEFALLYYLDTGDGWGGAPIYQDWVKWSRMGLTRGYNALGDCWGREGGPCWPTVVAIHQGWSIDECGDRTPIQCARCRDFNDDGLCSVNPSDGLRNDELEVANRGIRITERVFWDLFALRGVSTTPCYLYNKVRLVCQPGS
jgi:hypothetical protein